VNEIGFQKGRAEAAAFEPSVPICPEESQEVRMLFGVGNTHASAIGTRAGRHN